MDYGADQFLYSEEYYNQKDRAERKAQVTNKWIPVTGVWENNYQGNISMSFQMTAAIREKLMEIPTGTHVKLFPNTRKTENTPTAPDWNMSWKPKD